MVYPNPASNQCFITANTESETSLCQLFDLSGRMVLQTTLTPGVNNMNLQNLTSGCYLMKITDDKVVTTKKLVIRN